MVVPEDSADFFPIECTATRSMTTTDGSKLVSVEEISKHDAPTDSWIVVHGQVWDVTKFAPEHPGGAASKPLDPN